MPAPRRGEILMRFAQVLEREKDDLTDLMTREMGKVEAEAGGDVQEAIDMTYYMAGEGRRMWGQTTPSELRDKFNMSVRVPVGVVGAITPWNFPIAIPSWKLAPALVCGNTVVLKPAEDTPALAERFVELLAEAGVPAGVVNIVHGYGETAGQALVRHPSVPIITFTGSRATGVAVTKAAADNLKHVHLELGGKNAIIVLDDADVDAAIAGAAMGIFFNQGEVCTAGSRLYIHENLFDEVVDGVSRAAEAIKVGYGLDADTEMGPLVSAEQFDRVTGYLKIGADEGARAVTGGNAIDRPGFFVQPTVLVDATADHRIIREEIFGPVVAAMPFADIDDLAAQANDSVYGLAAGVWTRDLSKAHKLAKRIKAGTVHINTYHIYDAALPFGGYKQSGLGREYGPEGLSVYLQNKSIYGGKSHLEPSGSEVR